MTLRLVADDLTGALDTAAQFCGACGPIPVLFTPDGVADGHAAYDIGTREASEADAVRRARRAAPLLAHGDPAFKKVDSLLRGHWAKELAATLDAPFRSCVFAPAFPRQGRVTRAGRQWRRRADGTWEETGPDIRAALEQAGLHCVRGMEPAPSASPPVRLFDAESEADLCAIVRAANALPGPTLWCGSAGLAKALAGAAAVPRHAPRGAVLAIIGSRHPASAAQVADAAAALPPGAAIALRRGSGEEAEAVAAALAEAGRALVTFDFPPETQPRVAAARIAERLAHVLAHVPQPGTLVAAGGETLSAICAALAAGSLLVEGEFDAGVPASRMVGGHWDGIRVISKSGAFGDAGLLHAILAARHPAAEPLRIGSERRAAIGGPSR